jgi:hypothetical protein
VTVIILPLSYLVVFTEVPSVYSSIVETEPSSFSMLTLSKTYKRLLVSGRGDSVSDSESESDSDSVWFESVDSEESSYKADYSRARAS